MKANAGEEAQSVEVGMYTHGIEEGGESEGEARVWG